MQRLEMCNDPKENMSSFYTNNINLYPSFISYIFYLDCVKISKHNVHKSTPSILLPYYYKSIKSQILLFVRRWKSRRDKEDLGIVIDIDWWNVNCPTTTTIIKYTFLKLIHWMNSINDCVIGINFNWNNYSPISPFSLQ